MKIREIFIIFEKNFSTTSGFRTRCSKPLPCQSAPGEVLLVHFVLLDVVWWQQSQPVRGIRLSDFAGMSYGAINSDKTSHGKKNVL